MPAKIETCTACGWMGLAHLLAGHDCDRARQEARARAFWATVARDLLGGQR